MPSVSGGSGPASAAGRLRKASAPAAVALSVRKRRRGTGKMAGTLPWKLCAVTQWWDHAGRGSNNSIVNLCIKCDEGRSVRRTENTFEKTRKRHASLRTHGRNFYQNIIGEAVTVRIGGRMGIAGMSIGHEDLRMIKRSALQEHSLVGESFQESDDGIDLIGGQKWHSHRLDKRAVKRLDRKDVA